ncbi:anti-sigma factor [Pseudomonas sp. sp1636]|uniref:anti-sigma factor family protein n=1 Tax=Pseudomonas sp. sp1636 TaxID=3036707 RepID=UPI0025A63E9B|nr:anti-sigma factor [Pseudomonas sp. sp1636]MDM8349488.1 anti-sigma factor [Pseudomonas sp. sp1636]
MLTCREMAQLGSDVIDKQLSLGKRIAAYVHLRQCKNCRTYIKQLALTSAVLQALAVPPNSTEIEATLGHIQHAIEKRSG